MSMPPEVDPELKAAYRAAVDRLPVLTRIVFLSNLIDELSYREIAGRLSIDHVAVMACVAEALAMITAILDGERPKRHQSAQIVPAEVALHRRYRAYCEDSLRALGITTPIAWKRIDDDDVSAVKSIIQSMPKKVRQIAALYYGARLGVSQIAARKRIVPWIVRDRLRQLNDQVDAGPVTFENWLRELASNARESPTLTGGEGP